MFAKLVVIFALLGVATCDQYKSCPGVTPTGTLNDVTIEGCTPAQPCVLATGTTKAVTIDFTPSKASSSLKMSVYAIIAGVPIPYPGFDTNGCHKVSCPLVANTKYEYQNTLSVPSEAPAIPFQVKWQLTDDSSNTIGCFLVDVQIS